MIARCTATTASGSPCKGRASGWPRSVDGDPQLCGTHLPVALRGIRDAGFAELERRRIARLDAREPECWSWDPQIPLDRIADEYGWSADDFTPRFQTRDEEALRIAFAAWHGHRCAVCGFHDVRLVEDHDHGTGLIRGLLCRSCNGREPHDDGLFRKYRERPPAQILGIHLRYYDPWHGWAQPRAVDPNRLDNHPAYALAARLGERLGTREEEPDMSTPFSEFMKYTKPGPHGERCTHCNTFSLRAYTEPSSQKEEVVCTNPRCVASPLHRED